jgi:hypothetical protein
VKSIYPSLQSIAHTPVVVSTEVGITMLSDRVPSPVIPAPGVTGGERECTFPGISNMDSRVRGNDVVQGFPLPAFAGTDSAGMTMEARGGQDWIGLDVRRAY